MSHILSGFICQPLKIYHIVSVNLDNKIYDEEGISLKKIAFNLYTAFNSLSLEWESLTHEMTKITTKVNQ